MPTDTAVKPLTNKPKLCNFCSDPILPGERKFSMTDRDGKRADYHFMPCAQNEAELDQNQKEIITNVPHNSP